MSTSPSAADGTPRTRDPRLDRPWPALWTIIIGFFMILLDTTIVTVAIPHMQRSLNTDLTSMIWVTSGYLLAYAVPLLVSGRLGDRYGPKNMYLLGLAGFTATSLWCALSPTVMSLILARVFQGFAAALMTPQTMTMVTRMFAPKDRGGPLALWGATAGVASLVGPLAGGLLVDGPGWPWIFAVNVPIGIVGLFLAWRFVPQLSGQVHSFDWLGVVLSAGGLFAVVFGLQEASRYDWGVITTSLWGTGITITVPYLIGIGAVVLVAFVAWQHLNTKEPLIPLRLFTDRNFSAASVAISAMGATVIAYSIAFTIYLQSVHGLSPTQAALMTAPTAIMSLVLARRVGASLATVNPKWLILSGFGSLALGIGWLHLLATPDSSLLLMLVPLTLIGIANALIWGPLSFSATRNLTPDLAGAGSGVYNTTRQVGTVLGSAAIATLMSTRIAARLEAVAPDFTAGAEGAARPAVELPPAAAEPFAAAMGDALLLPFGLAVAGFIATLALGAPTQDHQWEERH